MNNDVSTASELFVAYQIEIRHLKAENERLRQALLLFGDKHNWIYREYDPTWLRGDPVKLVEKVLK